MQQLSAPTSRVRCTSINSRFILSPQDGVQAVAVAKRRYSADCRLAALHFIATLFYYFSGHLALELAINHRQSSSKPRLASDL